MSDSDLIEHTIKSELCFSGEFLKVFRDTVKLPDHRLARREYLKHPGAAAIIALLGNNQDGYRIVLEKQFRYAVNQVTVEIPAGKCDNDESIFTTARRELTEETGYSAHEWAFGGLVHPCLGYANERMEIWFARELTSGEQQLDSEEFIHVFTLSCDEFFDWCRQGKITDVKTLSAAFLLQGFLEKRLELIWKKY